MLLRVILKYFHRKKQRNEYEWEEAKTVLTEKCHGSGSAKFQADNRGPPWIWWLKGWSRGHFMTSHHGWIEALGQGSYPPYPEHSNWIVSIGKHIKWMGKRLGLGSNSNFPGWNILIKSLWLSYLKQRWWKSHINSSWCCGSKYMKIILTSWGWHC